MGVNVLPRCRRRGPRVGPPVTKTKHITRYLETRHTHSAEGMSSGMLLLGLLSHVRLPTTKRVTSTARLTFSLLYLE